MTEPPAIPGVPRIPIYDDDLEVVILKFCGECSKDTHYGPPWIQARGWYSSVLLCVCLGICPSPGGQTLICRDGALYLQARIEGWTVWLTQRSIAELFQVTALAVIEYLSSILTEDGCTRQLLGNSE